MAQPSQDPRTCKTCNATRKLPWRVAKTVVFPYGLLPEGETKKQRKSEVQEFVKNMNALMNEGGGSVCVHADNPNLLGQFDELVDDRLRELIPDGSSFEENFERHFHSDKVHVIFRVKQRQRSVSTFNFNTKMSLNKGLVDPTHAEMRHFLQRFSGSESAEDECDSESKDPTKEFTFDSNSEVAHPKNVFVESVNVQAKRIPDEVLQHPEKVVQFVKFCWNKGKLPMYISAFSKLDKGGSVYFGLHEQKTEGRPEWDPVDEKRCRHVLQIVDKEWMVWLKNEEQTVYHVAKIADVPNKEQEKTGKYLCEGIVLTESQRRKFSKLIQDKVRSDMLWHPVSDQEEEEGNRVDVQFLKVTKGVPDLWVVKIIVKKYRGLSFYDRTGPDSYKILNKTLTNFTFDEWLTGK